MTHLTVKRSRLVLMYSGPSRLGSKYSTQHIDQYKRARTRLLIVKTNVVNVTFKLTKCQNRVSRPSRMVEHLMWLSFSASNLPVAQLKHSHTVQS